MPASPSSVQIRRCLDRILASPGFVSSERMCRFLRQAVERTLAGRASDLKEYTLGIEVFDRPTAFDPRVDPIVRVEARRLRDKLARYYAGPGAADPCVIELPKGSYVPVFRDRAAPAKEAAPASVTPRSIVVLPFTAPDSEFLGDGLTQQIIHRLTRIPSLRVLGWQSASRVRDRHDAFEAADELRAAYALAGSIRVDGKRLRVSVQLIDAASREFLWSEFYDRTVSDLFAIEEDIADAIVAALRVQFGFVRGRKSCPEAHELYVRGRYHWNKRTADGIRLSTECFRRAVDLDPEFALAWAGIADACVLQADYGLAEPGDVVEAARRAAERALELNPQLGEAEAALGYLRGHAAWDWEGSERHLRRAMELSPAYATAFHWYGIDHCALLGRHEEAAEALNRSIELDPLASIIREGCGYLALLKRRYDDAIAEYERLLLFDPTFYKVYTSLGRVWIHKGDYNRATEYLEKGLEVVGAEMPSILGALGQAYALAGRTDAAREILRRMDTMAEQRFVPCTCFATVHIGLGDYSAAIDWLERACQRRQFSVTSMGVHPLYDPLRSNPRFQRLLGVTGLG